MSVRNDNRQRSPTKFQVFRSLQSDYGKHRNAGGKAAERERKK